jgi:1,2-diacylglycerol 3-beta-galactosyltransferase
MPHSLVKVLILTADAGFGHRSAAKAVAEALRFRYGDAVDAVIANPLDSKLTLGLLRESQADYDRWVNQVPELYKLGYDASAALIPTRVMEDSLAVLFYEAVREAFNQHRPDVVLTTYPMYQASVSLLYRTTRHHIPFFTAVTDLATVHRVWFHRKVDGCLVPNRIVAEMAVSNQVPEVKVIITGIPVYPDISLEKRSREEIRAELGWGQDLTTILAVGSRRSTRMFEMLNVVNHFGAPLQVVVVAGKNEELFQKLKVNDWHIPVRLLNFVDNMPALMKASDLVMCKAGGLIVTESLACGLPMLLTEVIPGQETGNADYVRSAQAGMVINSRMELLESLSHLLSDDHALLKRYAVNSRAIGCPESAFKVAEILWQAAKGRSAGNLSAADLSVNA